MVGLGTWFGALMAIAAFFCGGVSSKLSAGFYGPSVELPLPYIATTAGWMTAEIGRQPWLVYGLIRTVEGYFKHVGAGNSLFTLLGFLGMYTCSRSSGSSSSTTIIEPARTHRSHAHTQRNLSPRKEPTSMGTLWFWIVAVMLTAYVVLDGFDLGVGILYLFVARTEAERAQALRSIGPVWDGNEVWLLAAGARSSSLSRCSTPRPLAAFICR